MVHKGDCITTPKKVGVVLCAGGLRMAKPSELIRKGVWKMDSGDVIANTFIGLALALMVVLCGLLMVGEVNRLAGNECLRAGYERDCYVEENPEYDINDPGFVDAATEGIGAILGIFLAVFLVFFFYAAFSAARSSRKKHIRSQIHYRVTRRK